MADGRVTNTGQREMCVVWLINLITSKVHSNRWRVVVMLLVIHVLTILMMSRSVEIR